MTRVGSALGVARDEAHAWPALCIRTLEEQDDDAGDAALAKYQRVAEALGAGATAPDDVTETVKRLVT